MAAREGAINGAAREAAARGHMEHMQTMRVAADHTHPHHPPHVPRNEINQEPSANLAHAFKTTCLSFAFNPSEFCGSAKKTQVDPQTGMPIG